MYKRCDGQIQLLAKDERVENFDFLIWSGLPSGFEKAARNHPHLLHPDERNLLKANVPAHTASSLVSARDLTRGDSGNIYIPNWDVQSFNSKVSVDIDMYGFSRDVSNQDYVIGNFTYADGQPGDDKMTFVVYQYGNRTVKPSLMDLRNEIRSHYENFGGTDIEVHHTSTYEYMPRWDMEYAENGAHWSLYDLQGKHNVWLIGGGCISEGVNSVMGYNQLLLSKMQNSEC